MIANKLEENKEKIIEKILEEGRRFVSMAVDKVIEYIREWETNSELAKEPICASMIAETKAKGMIYVKPLIPLILDVLAKEGYLEEEVKAGVPHYKLKE